MMKVIDCILTVCIALALASCADDSFEERTVIPEAEWAQENRVAFDVDIKDTISGYVFGLEFRHLEILLHL